MTERQIMIGDTTLVALLDRHERALTTAVLDALVAELPVYAMLPKELLQGDVRRVVVQALRMFRAAVETDGLPDEDALDGLAASARLRAEEGVPMDVVMAAYFQGVRTCTDLVFQEAHTQQREAMTAAMRMLTRFLGAVTRAVAVGYAPTVEAGEDLVEARNELAAALLAGQDGSAAAERCGYDLRRGWVVVCVAVGATADEARPEVDHTVAQRRKMRRLRAELARSIGTEPLFAPHREGLLVLVENTGAATAELSRWAGRLAEAAGRAARAQVWVGAGVARTSAVPTAAETAATVATLVRRTGRSPGGYLVRDVALEYQLAMPSPARDELIRLLSPVQDLPDLSITLQTYLRCGGDRRATAVDLHVHVNTVDNRLRRIGDLTGLDATQPADYVTLAAASMSALTVPPR